MSDDKILLHRDGAVGYITFNNPKRHNAVSLEMWESVVEALKSYEADDSVRVVVVTGAGGKSPSGQPMKPSSITTCILVRFIPVCTNSQNRRSQ